MILLLIKFKIKLLFISKFCFSLFDILFISIVLFNIISFNLKSVSSSLKSIFVLLYLKKNSGVKFNLFLNSDKEMFSLIFIVVIN